MLVPTQEIQHTDAGSQNRMSTPYHSSYCIQTLQQLVSSQARKKEIPSPFRQDFFRRWKILSQATGCQRPRRYSSPTSRHPKPLANLDNSGASGNSFFPPFSVREKDLPARDSNLSQSNQSNTCYSYAT